MKKFLKISLYILLVIAILTVCAAVWFTAVTSGTEFDEAKLKKSEPLCVVYDVNDNKINDIRRF